MLHNYIKVIIRNFISDRLYSFIIVTGLAIGLSVCLMIVQYIHFEQSFDKQYDNADRIYYTYMRWRGMNRVMDLNCHPAVAPLIKRSVSGVENAGRIVPMAFDKGASVVLRWKEGNNKSYLREDELYFADASILEIFSIPMLKGSVANSLQNPYTVVLTENLADKLFPGVDPLNEILQVQIYRNVLSFVVTGVVSNPKPNSSIQFNALFSMASIDAWSEVPLEEIWVHPIYTTFIKLREGVHAEDVEAGINKAATEPLSKIEDEFDIKEVIHLYPFSDFHFFQFYKSDGAGSVKFSGDKRLVHYFTLLAAIILLISWANHINLTTARAIQRAKEIGLRKVNGAGRKHIILQFLMEFFMMNVISLLLALTITQLFFNKFAAAIGSKAEWYLWKDPLFWILLFVFLLISTLMSGIYPAFIMSNYNPLRVLKGNFGRSKQGLSIRSGLVITQFVLSVFLITSIYIVAKQLSFLMKKDQGFSTEQVLVIQNLDLDTLIDRTNLYHQFKAIAGSMSSVKAVSADAAFPGSTGTGWQGFYLTDNPAKEQLMFEVEQVSGDYFKTMDIQLLAGRDFIDDQPGEDNKMIITSYTARQLGFDEPADAIGTTITLIRNEKNYEVIGVVRDFTFSNKTGIAGHVFVYKTWQFEYYNYFLVKLQTNDAENVVKAISQQWPQLTNDSPFDYFFLDAYFDRMYREERQFAGVFGFFSVIGVFVACMGLFGLSLYNTGCRTKEIGIRKSLGSSAERIMWLFTKDYLRLVAIAVLIGLPLGLWGINTWLKSYPNRIAIQGDAIIIPVLITLCIAVGTVGYHTFKVAHLNPVKSLRAD